VISSGIIFFGIDATWSTFVTGAVIVLAVALEDELLRVVDSAPEDDRDDLGHRLRGGLAGRADHRPAAAGSIALIKRKAAEVSPFMRKGVSV
jgi:hypothetical protein